jgi:indole-3-glycerol phosphate synthase
MGVTMKAAGTYLEKILTRTAADLPARQKQKPLGMLRALAKAAPKSPPFEQTLRRTPAARIIAELKRKSPSKGFIDRDLDVAVTAQDYAKGGAAAISVLTEGPFFAGTLDDLSRVRQACSVPLLRKDFIIDPYQIVEARAHGAGAVLLIVAALDGKQLSEFIRLAREFELEALVEVHDAAELDRALDAGAAMIGINNRDLKTFEVDLGTTERLAPAAAKAGTLVVAESGIKGAGDIRRLAAAGADAFLVGETLLLAADRAKAVRELVDAR